MDDTQAPQPTDRAADATSPASRVTLAAYDTYEEAQRAVDHLSDERFEVRRVAIVGEGMKMVEQVTGRLDWGRALANGAGGGALTGAFIGFLFGLFVLPGPFALALWGLLLGAVVGAIMGGIGYAMSGGRRDFTSVGRMQADRYLVMVDAEVAEEARRVLARLPAR